MSIGRTTTEAAGEFSLAVARGGRYRLSASLPGFAGVTRELPSPSAGCGPPLTLSLDLAPPSSGAGAAIGGSWAAATDAALDIDTLATALALPRPVLDRMGAVLVEFSGRTVRPDRGWLAERRRRATAGLATPAAPLEAGGVRPPASPPAGSQARPATSAKPAVTRPALAQRAYQGTVSYALNGSALDSPPYQLRPGADVPRRPYSRQTFGLSLSGPFRLPRLYDGGRRTTVSLTYSGNRGGTLLDQYATVPTEAVRAGDFAGAPAPLIDPATGQPFPGQRIPGERVHPTARSLLRFIPAPNLPGTTRNFQHTATSDSRAHGVTVRVVHQLVPPAPRPPAGPARTSASLTAQLQVRDTRTEQINVFPALGGATRSRTIAAPVTVTVARGRTSQLVRLDVSTSLSRAESRYAGVEDVAAAAGISGLAREPFTWGVPALIFSTYSSARDVAPTRRDDVRLLSGYEWKRSTGQHTVAWGAESRFDWSNNQTDANARGSFVFTGRHTAGSTRVPRGAGFDFADFLLGLPQQASVQYGPGQVRIRGRALSLYLQDDWRRSNALTITAGLRYELVWPLVEANHRMVNLDVTSDFTGVMPVLSGAAGPFSGSFPRALMHADTDNLAPRVAVAWKGPHGVTIRSGYGVSFNSGPYSAIVKRLVAQPPFAASQESLGSLTDPLDLADPFLHAALTQGATTFGVERDYTIGVVETWNAELSRPFRTVWTASGGYTGKRGSSLDLIRTPNRDPEAADFQWQSADGRSRMHGLTLRLQRRKARGIGGGLTYTVARAHDNMAIAQNDLDLDAEWSLSSFDRRHQLSCDVSADLPFGPGRAWLTRGPWAVLAGGWSASATFTAQSGTPLTPRVTGARAANRPLRPDATGEPIALASPTIDLFFNTAAFALPEPGRFGTANRNSIIGPGSRLLNASLARDVRLGGARVLTARLDAANLLNLVNYSAVNSTVNSSAFGQVTSVRPMRTLTLSAQVRF